MNTSADVSKLRDDLETILSRYHVPMDDRGFIIDKIEATLERALKAQQDNFEETVLSIRREIESERGNVQQEVDKIRSTAIEGITEVSGKLEDAYNEGFAQATSQIPSRPSTFQVIVGISLVTIGLILAARSIWKNI